LRGAGRFAEMVMGGDQRKPERNERHRERMYRIAGLKRTDHLC